MFACFFLSVCRVVKLQNRRPAVDRSRSHFHSRSHSRYHSRLNYSHSFSFSFSLILAIILFFIRVFIPIIPAERQSFHCQLCFFLFGRSGRRRRRRRRCSKRFPSRILGKRFSSLLLQITPTPYTVRGTHTRGGSDRSSSRRDVL